MRCIQSRCKYTVLFSKHFHNTLFSNNLTSLFQRLDSHLFNYFNSNGILFFSGSPINCAEVALAHFLDDFIRLVLVFILCPFFILSFLFLLLDLVLCGLASSLSELPEAVQLLNKRIHFFTRIPTEFTIMSFPTNMIPLPSCRLTENACRRCSICCC